MDWFEYSYKFPTEKLDEATAIVTLYNPYGIYIEDYSDMEEFAPTMRGVDYYSDRLMNADKNHSIIHIYFNSEDNPLENITVIEERFFANEIPFEKSSAKIDADAMLSAWKKHYKPTPISKSITVVPSWIEYFPKQGEKILMMDPENAFGSGTHESTNLSATLMEKYINEGDPVLDIGTGSGILAIAALLLSAKRAVGVDIDEIAVETAKKNAIKNGVADKSTFVCGNLCDKVEGKYNLITANIVADVIVYLLEFVEKFMEDDATIIVSGIIDERENDVLEAVKLNRFKVAEKLQKNGWVALAIKKSN